MLLIGVLSPAAAEQQETLQGKVSLKVRWEIDEETEINKGYFSLQMNGTLNLDPLSVQTPGGKALIPLSLKYSAKSMSGSYHYYEKITDKKPDCPNPVVAIYKGGGPISAADGSALYVRRQKHLASAYLNKLNPAQRRILAQMPGQDLLVDYYDFECGTYGHPSVPGDRQESDCTYSNTEKKFSLGTFSLGFKIPPDGKMKDNRTWKAKALGGPPGFKIGLSDLPDKMGRPPFKPTKSPGGNVTYTVSWAFGKAVLEPLDGEVQAVSFHYTDLNQDLQKSLQLWCHGSSPRKIESPEWKRGGRNKPAAFVRDYPFRVKAEFKCRRPVKNAEIRAHEAVIAGLGFGDELTQAGDLKISGRKITGEFMIKEPRKKIGTHKITWQWKGDIEFEDEPGKIKANLGESNHTIYIVGGVPVENVCPYEYAVRKGCGWADGTVGDDETLWAIWDKFWNIPAPDNGGILSYDHKEEWPGTTNALLTNGKGKCGAWADFFKDTVGVHGIPVSKVEITPDTPYDRLVTYPIAGQGNQNPLRVFTDHAINAYGGLYFDPSYGHCTPENLVAYENEIFKGYCVFEAVQFHYENDLSSCSQIKDTDEKNMTNSLADCLISLGEDPDNGCFANKELVREVSAKVYE